MSATSHDYRRDIDGLRAVAVLCVIGYHGFPERVPGGFVGVDVFFVISGFLISRIILGGLDQKKFTFRDFYTRRIKRIFPALALVLAACLCAGWYFLMPDEYAQLGAHVASGAGFIVNLVLWSESGYFDRAAELKPLLHLWSLGIEEQFYFVWPMILFVTTRLRARPIRIAIAILACSFAFGMWTLSTDAVAAFYSPISRFWELTIGSVLACYSLSREHDAPKKETLARGAARNLAALVGLACILGAVALVNRTSPYPGWRAIAPTIGTLFLIVAGPRAWVNATLLSNRAMVGVGLISYPLYLWHWPLLVFLRIATLEPPSAQARAAAIVASFVLAGLTYVFVERPVRFGKSRARVVRVLVASMVGVGGAGAGAFATDGLAWRFGTLEPYAAFRYDFTSDARVGQCWLALPEPGDKYATSCIDKDTTKPLVFVWGDSHAARLYPGLKVARGDTFRFGQFTRSTCPPIAGWGYPSCQSANAFVLEKIRQEKPSTVILFAFWNDYGRTWGGDELVSQKLEETIASVRAAGVSQILVLGPAPQWIESLPHVVVDVARHDPERRIPLRTFHASSTAVRDVDRALAHLLENAGVTYVSAWTMLCNDDGCLTRVDDEPSGLMSWDYGHLTTKGGAHIAERLPIAGAGTGTGTYR